MPWVSFLITSDVWMHVYKHSVAAGNIYYNPSVKYASLFKDSDKIYQPQKVYKESGFAVTDFLFQCHL